MRLCGNCSLPPSYGYMDFFTSVIQGNDQFCPQQGLTPPWNPSVPQSPISQCLFTPTSTATAIATTATPAATATKMLPCILLCLTSLLYVIWLSRLRDAPLPESKVFKSRKMAITALTMLLSFELTVRCFHLVSFTDVIQYQLFFPALLLFNVILTGRIIGLQRQKGFHSSGVTSIICFCLTLLICTPFFRKQTSTDDPVHCVLIWVKSAVSVCLLLLSFVSEGSAPKQLPPSGVMRPCPEPAASLWSRLMFSWMKDLLVDAKERRLADNDLFALLPREQSSNVTARLQHAWDQQVQQARLRNERDGLTPSADTDKFVNADFSAPPATAKVRRRTKSQHAATDEINQEIESLAATKTEASRERAKDSTEESEKRESLEVADEKSQRRPKSRPSFMRAMVATFGADFLVQQLYMVVSQGLRLSDPLLLGLLLDFLEDSTAPSGKGYVICLVMVASNVLQSLLYYRSNFCNHAMFIRIKVAIVNMIYRKALTMTSESRQKSTLGQAVNMMTVDSRDVSHIFTDTASEMWTVPLTLLVVLALLYRLLGPSMIVSVVLLVVMVPINSLAERRMMTMHTSIMEHKDHRLKLLTQVINGIKILKMYTWEPSYLKKMDEARQKELDVMWWKAFWVTAIHFYWQVTPYMVSVTALMAYVYTSDDHYLSPSTAFVALSLIDILRGTVGTVPEIVAHLVKVKVSIRRINDFMNYDDLEDNVDAVANDDDVISITNGHFSWASNDAPTLKNINITVKKGSLVAVVGTVGCGKSSLLAACLGDMNTLHGHVSRKGTVAYVPQQAWIQHATLKDNVLFGRPLNQHVYEQCLEDCALQADLDILPAGDNTEIGEKGINLSGGQKQRVSLARAVYSEADLYLLDDPLSAVDSHVGTHIFHKIVGHQGMLAGKTRVLVTHGLQWLPLVDQIVVMSHGHVTQVGTYSQLLSHNGPFTRFLKHHLKHIDLSADHADDHSTAEDQKLKADILQRLESIPSSGNKDEEDDSDDSSGSSTDNELIVDKLTKSSSLRDDPPASDDGQGNSSTDEDSEKGDKPQGNSDKGKLVEDEDFKVRHATWNTFRQYGRAVGAPWVALIILLFAGQHWALRAGELTLSQWTDDPQLNNLTSLPPDSGDRLALNQYYLAVYAAFGVFQAVSTLSFKLVMLMRQVVLAGVLHHKMMARVLRAPLVFFDRTPVGRIVARFSQDLHIMDTELTETMEWALFVVLGGISKLVVICYITPLFLLLLFPIAAVFYYVQYWYTPTMRQMERFETKTRSPVYSFFAETLGGTAVIRAFGHQQRFIHEFERRVDLTFAVTFTWGCADKWLGIRMRSLSAMMVGTVIVMAVAFRGTLSAGLAGLLVSVAIDITEVIRGLVHLVSWIQTEIVSVDRVHEYCTMPVEADWKNEDNTPCEQWPKRGEVKVNDLTLRYRDGLDLVLKGLTFHIQPGQKVGIVGRTGAGKSSLTLALFRLIEPAGGVIHIDDLATRDLGLHDLRGRLTILPQDPVIFAGSMRMNLDPLAQYSEAELWEALRHAHLGDFVCGLRHGLDHHCGEGGDNFSVGQRQLLCLARALLHKRRVLVLDEATAAVDLETDHLIQLTLRQHFAHCTVLTIAHRIHTIMDYDRILVMDQGQVVEYDSPKNLMDTPTSLFRKMATKAGLLPTKSSGTTVTEVTEVNTDTIQKDT